MGVQVSFNYAAWVALYPEFAYVPQAQVIEYFNLATMYQDNSGAGFPQNPTQQLNLLNMVTAHLTQLFASLANGQPASQLVGRINSASQGSVSVATQLDLAKSDLAAFFAQTKYGLACWVATMPFRRMRYFPGPTITTNPWPYG